jgi:aminopeptidase YwaD
VIFFYTGSHPDYHRPTDTADKINVSGMRQVVDLAEKVILDLGGDPQRPEYVQVASKFTATGGRGGPKLGIMPNYDEDKEGVQVGGVIDDGPAAKGGLKAGDLIVELGGKSIKSLNAYMVIMAQQQSGQTLEVGILRDGKKLTLKVVPQ